MNKQTELNNIWKQIKALRKNKPNSSEFTIENTNYDVLKDVIFRNVENERDDTKIKENMDNIKLTDTNGVLWSENYGAFWGLFAKNGGCRTTCRRNKRKKTRRYRKNRS